MRDPWESSSPSTRAPPACARSPSTRRVRRAGGRTGSSPSTSRSRAGSSTTPTRSGRRCVATLAELVVVARPNRWPPSASPTSARRSWPGIAVDRSAPRHRAIVWQDRRTAARCDALRDEGHVPLVRSTTGLVLDPYFSATKVAWLLAEGGVAADADLAFGTVDSWLLWNLTGGAEHATEPSNASRTMLFDIGTLAWTDELLRPLRRARGVPARGAAVERAVRGRRRRPVWRACRSAASPATSRRPCSARPASSPA